MSTASRLDRLTEYSTDSTGTGWSARRFVLLGLLAGTRGFDVASTHRLVRSYGTHMETNPVVTWIYSTFTLPPNVVLSPARFAPSVTVFLAASIVAVVVIAASTRVLDQLGIDPRVTDAWLAVLVAVSILVVASNAATIAALGV